MRGLLAMTAAAALAAAAACSGAPEGRGASAPVETGAASARAGAVPLRIVVRLAGGHPVAGASVRWRVTAGGGSIAPRIGETDSAGSASARWTLVSDTIPNRAEASARVGERWEITTFSLPAQAADTGAAPAGAAD